MHVRQMSYIFVCIIMSINIRLSSLTNQTDNMQDPKIYQPTEAELDVLQVLWESQPATVRFIHEKIQEKKAVGYTTTLKQLQRMTEKKMVNREKSGKTHFYTAVPNEAEVQQSLFQRLQNTIFKGSAMNMIMHALGQNNTSAEELETLQEWLATQKNKKQ